jgi:hypothetical protein
VRHLSQHSSVGSAFTLRNYQALRVSLFEKEGRPEEMDNAVEPFFAFRVGFHPRPGRQLGGRSKPSFGRPRC